MNRSIIAGLIRLLVVWTLLISLPLSTYADPPRGEKRSSNTHFTIIHPMVVASSVCDSVCD